MKISNKTMFFCFLFGLPGVVSAVGNQNTVSLGYAHSHYKGDLSGNSPGFNIKYNWEKNDSNLGVIGSITRTSSNLSIPQSTANGRISHLSVLAGPSYRFNEYVNVYALAGVAHDKAKIADASGSINSFSYGAGVRVSPVKNWSVDTSYEQARNSDSDKTSVPLKVGTWVLGVGYSF